MSAYSSEDNCIRSENEVLFPLQNTKHIVCIQKSNFQKSYKTNSNYSFETQKHGAQHNKNNFKITKCDSRNRNLKNKIRQSEVRLGTKKYGAQHN